MTDATLTLPTEGLDAAALRDVLDVVAGICSTADIVGFDDDGMHLRLVDLGRRGDAPRPAPVPEPARPAAKAPLDLTRPRGPAKDPAPRRKPGPPKGARSTGPAADVLAHVTEHGPVVAPDGDAAPLIAAATGLARPAVTQAITRLVKAGQLVVDNDPAHKRTYAVGVPGQSLPPRPFKATPANEPTHTGKRTLAPVPDEPSEPKRGGGLVDQVERKGLGDKLAQRAGL